MTAHATGLERLEFERLRERLLQLFAVLEEAADSAAAPAPGEWVPPVDISESNEAVMVYVEVPGLEASQVSVSLTGSHLRVSGEKGRPARRRAAATSHLCSERNYGRFDRTLPLHQWSISVRRATAELKQGVLAVRLPKISERRGASFQVPVKETE